MSLLLLAAAVALLAFDFQNLLSLWWGRVLVPNGNESHDFTIVIPLFGDPKYFADRQRLALFRENILVAIEISPEPMRRFADELEREGWRVCRIRQQSPNPASLMKAALSEVSTGYALRLDADSRIDIRLPQFVAAVVESGADICSTKIEVGNRRTIPAKVQALEYRMAMLARHFRPWLTSGACFIAKTEAMRRIYAKHSLWSPGEDIETGRVAHALKMKIRHVDMVVTTEVPETWRGWFRQRRLWWAGNFRHTFVNIDRNVLQLPVMTVYLVAAVWASVYGRWWTAIDYRSLPRTLPVLLAVYVVVTFVANIQVASPWMLVFPLYSLVQLTLLPPLGACTYVKLAWKRRSLGRYRFGHLRREEDPDEFQPALAQAEAAAEPRPWRAACAPAPTDALGDWASAVRAAA